MSKCNLRGPFISQSDENNERKSPDASNLQCCALLRNCSKKNQCWSRVHFFLQKTFIHCLIFQKSKFFFNQIHAFSRFHFSNSKFKLFPKKCSFFFLKIYSGRKELLRDLKTRETQHKQILFHGVTIKVPQCGKIFCYIRVVHAL